VACNFRILFHENSESIHLKLMGDFDGSSAHELLNTIKTCSRHVRRVFIHTSGLKDVNSFGKAVFHNNFHQLKRSDTEFIFTGENGKSLSV
jgi:anti-anti-sigma regulatory factor